MDTTQAKWKVPVSKMAENTFNPIRSVVDSMQITPHPEKPMISLALGDPTVFGNLVPPDNVVEGVIRAVERRMHNGYGPSIGCQKARAAVARFVSTPGYEVRAEDVVLTHGCSSALDLSISCLADPGDTILVPRPGFPLYQTLAKSLDIRVKYYDLLPDKAWEADLKNLEEQIDHTTRAVVVCNPSNPCGSVYSSHHLTDILQVAARHRLPVIADEVYEHCVFPGHTYHSLASLSRDVPILACSGLTKRFLVPGWRLGWVVVHDRHDSMSQVKDGLEKLSQRILGPNSLIQAALPDILEKTADSFFSETIKCLQNNALMFFQHLSQISGLRPLMPQGSMFMMVGIDMKSFPEFTSDVEFTERLVQEQSVFCLPSKCFQYQDYFRIVLTTPTEKVLEACQRIRAFCEEHHRPG